jgi:hypothetical protein
LSAHEGDVPMAQLVQVTQGEFGRPPVVENNIGDPDNLPVPGNGDDGNWQLVKQRRINGNDAFSAAPHEQAGIFFNHVGLMAVLRAEIEVAFAHEVIAYAAHDQGVVAIAQFRNKDPHSERALFAERACKQARLVVEFPGGGPHALAGFSWDRAPWDIIEHYGNRGGAEAEVVRENLQADGFITRRLVFLPGSHG